jgi:hypothetical protein
VITEREFPRGTLREGLTQGNRLEFEDDLLAGDAVLYVADSERKRKYGPQVLADEEDAGE